ncbi:DUF4129 domain-containing protein [Bacillus sp. S/N-304-OC-R1]|uniref:DUF4129 domain-containing protein n=1 Tax=Bacillus sp. S/N-304-OC-R1 TaxID=2758034 RepID=UPI001C8EF88B|nr:DUF4129 domain-containing protein [Bacillus sp. S/N-304-OC-R1]MBY0120460.1 DUF4129 domain-containing protein [Bacillus sp. S/N-304-OC-R1]
MLDKELAQEELQKILEGNEYRVYYDQSQNLFQLWWKEAKKWISDRLSNLFPSFEPSGNVSSFILIVMIIIIIALLGFVLFFTLRNRMRNRLLRNNNPLQSNIELNWTYHQHMNEAEKQELLGNYNLSTRHMFLALLLYFHEKEWLEARIWKTNWEYYDELQKVNSRWADQFFYLAYLFDEATYGERNINKEEYSRFKKEAMFWISDQNVSLDG